MRRGAGHRDAEASAAGGEFSIGKPLNARPRFKAGEKVKYMCEASRGHGARVGIVSVRERAAMGRYASKGASGHVRAA